MNKANNPNTERIGVSALQLFFAEHNWFFREQPILDQGIDAHVEIVENYTATGKLVALQIKTGPSYFKEETEGAFVYRPNERHVRYWTNHSLPVVIVLWDPAPKQGYWQYVSEETLKRAGEGWKILVPKVNTVEPAEAFLSSLKDLVQPEPYIRRLNRLRFDRRWMNLIAEGQQVRIEFANWVNKSLPRYQITISAENEEETGPLLYAPGVGVEAMLRHFFPWADFSLDRDAHEEGARPLWDAECYRTYDKEEGITIYSKSFDEWYQRPTDEIVPVSEDGEIESYSLFLSLNDLGKAFLLVDDYLTAQDVRDEIGFPLE